MKNQSWYHLASLVVAMLVLALAGACGNSDTSGSEADRGHEPGALEPIALDSGEKLQVVATTNIVGDVVKNVGGDRIELTTLMVAGVDPHTYLPTPAGTAAIHDAHIVFANGAGLEAGLDEVFDNAGGSAIKVHLSDGLALVGADSDRQDDGHEHEADDAHVWFDVQNVIHWVETMEQTLSALDPANASTYQANAANYSRELEDLDAWVNAQVTSLPEQNRKLVTNHPAFGYLAGAYGLEQVGAVYPVSPSSEPSAREIAALEDTIREFGLPAVFTESTVNPRLAEQVAQDTGVKLIPLYSGSLGLPGSGAETYILLIRYDVGAIVDALK